MDRTQAEAILDGHRETASALLVRLDELVEANRRLEARVADLERQLNRTSRDLNDLRERLKQRDQLARAA